MAGKEIGTVSDYFAKIEVAAIKLNGGLKIGDKIHFKGATSDFKQTVKSMQINRKPVDKARAKDEVGIRVSDRVRRNDKVFLVE
ncbi:MAG: translation elongation factor-like protein [Nanoarchaeota archaeon]